MKVLFAAIFILFITQFIYAQPTLFGSYQSEQIPKAPKQKTPHDAEWRCA
jgi:hypothetical protein